MIISDVSLDRWRQHVPPQRHRGEHTVSVLHCVCVSLWQITVASPVCVLNRQNYLHIKEHNILVSHTYGLWNTQEIEDWVFWRNKHGVFFFNCNTITMQCGTGTYHAIAHIVIHNICNIMICDTGIYCAISIGTYCYTKRRQRASKDLLPKIGFANFLSKNFAVRPYCASLHCAWSFFVFVSVSM